jgi:hypothetical protein
MLPSDNRTHGVPSSCAICTLTQRPPGGVSSLTEPSVVLDSCALMHLLNALWQSSTEFTAEFCLQLCLSYTALPLEVFSNLKGLLPELLTSVCASARLCLTPHEFRSASTVHWDSESQHSVTPLWHEPSKTSQT